MSSKWLYTKTLSAEGEKELGYIFTAGSVPLTQNTPIYASLRGEINRVFLVDWTKLTEEQQDKVIEYMMDKFGEGIPDQIRKAIAANGHFPLRDKYVIEAYSIRNFV